MTAPLFAHPQFSIKPDTGPRRYGNVLNALEVYQNGRDHVAHVQVNTELFSILRYQGVRPLDTVTLYLDEVAAGRFVFGYCLDPARPVDLWYIARGEILPCLLQGR